MWGIRHVTGTVQMWGTGHASDSFIAIRLFGAKGIRKKDDRFVGNK